MRHPDAFERIGDALPTLRRSHASVREWQFHVLEDGEIADQIEALKDEPAAVGVALRLAGAAAVTRYLQGMLFGLTPLDATTFIAVSVTFALVATVASYVPARRATKVDPAVALRCE